jgi:hypothetical protein
MYIYTYICIYTCVYIYIYTYTYLNALGESLDNQRDKLDATTSEKIMYTYINIHT